MSLVCIRLVTRLELFGKQRLRPGHYNLVAIFEASRNNVAIARRVIQRHGTTLKTLVRSLHVNPRTAFLLHHRHARNYQLLATRSTLCGT